MKLRLIALLLLLTNTSYAAENCTKSVGVVTPCVGVLQPKDWAVGGQMCLEVDLPKCIAQAAAATAVKDASMTALTAELDIERQYTKKLEKKLLSYVVPPDEPRSEGAPWYQSNWFIFGAGFVLGAGAVIGGVYGANSTR